MALNGKLEVVFVLKSSVEKFYNCWKKESHQIPDHTPQHVKAVNVHDGDWASHGQETIKTVHYHHQGKEEEFKEKVEFDDENKTITITGLEGHIMDLYKVYKVILQATPKENGSLIKCTLEFEGQNETISPPYHYFDFAMNVIKGIDDGLTKAEL